MWPYIKPFWVRAVLTLVLAIPVGMLDAVIAWAIKPFTDGIMTDNPIFPAWLLPVVIVAFTTVQGGLTYTVGYLNTWVGGKITNLLKADLFKKLLTFETEFFTSKNSGDILVKFSGNADTACAGLLSNIKSFVQKFFTSISFGYFIKNAINSEEVFFFIIKVLILISILKTI